MNNKIYFKLFLNDLFLPIISCLFLVYINYLHIKSLSGNTHLILGELSMLRESLQTSILCFAFFMFVSYYFTDKARHNSLLECVRVTGGGSAGMYMKQLGVLVCLDALFTVFYLFYNLYVYFSWDIGHPEVLWHIVKCLFLYIFMVSFIAILLGILIAQLFKRFGALLIMVAIVLLTSPVASFIAAGFYDSGIDLMSFYDFICLFPRDLSTRPDNAVGYSLLPDRVSAVVFFAALLAGLIAIKTLNKKSIVRNSISAICGIICAVSLVIYVLPGARTFSERNLDGAYFADHVYYSAHKGSAKEKDGGFSVVKYEMNLTIKNQLSAEVTMFLDDDSLKSYIFTLYHGFTVKSAKNQDGVSLDFTRDGDYIEITGSGASTASIKLSYEGYNPCYFTHSQGIALSGNLPFFPRGGYQAVYDMGTYDFYSNFLEKPAEFYVEVNYPKTVYSNLDRISGNVFSGTSDNLVFVSGFLTETNIDGIDVVYPYLDIEQFGEEMLRNDVLSFINSKQDDNPVKKIIIVFHRPPGKFSRCNYYSDGTITTVQLRILSRDYPQCLVENRKQSLYSLYQLYTKYHSDFENRLIYEREVYADGESGLAMMLQDAVERLGEEEVLAKLENYFNNNSDTRNHEEFFSDLQKQYQ